MNCWFNSNIHIIWWADYTEYPLESTGSHTFSARTCNFVHKDVTTSAGAAFAHRHRLYISVCIAFVAPDRTVKNSASAYWILRSRILFTPRRRLRVASARQSECVRESRRWHRRPTVGRHGHGRASGLSGDILCAHTHCIDWVYYWPNACVIRCARRRSTTTSSSCWVEWCHKCV